MNEKMYETKDLIYKICEMYDYQCLSIGEIALALDMNENEVYQIVTAHSDNHYYGNNIT
jgi:hypothetical protein